MPGQGSGWPGTAPTLTWHLWAVIPFPRRGWVTSQTSLGQGRDRLGRCSLWAALAFCMGPWAADQHGAIPTGEEATKPATAQKIWREREGLRSGQDLAISFPLQAHLLPTITGRGWRDHRPQSSCHPPRENKVPGAPGSLPSSGDTVPSQPAPSRVCPALDWRQFPPR